MADDNAAGPVPYSFADESVDYSDLKAWIAEQESLPEPTPLTEVQRKAILKLKHSIAPKSEIVLVEKDWVSLLHQFRDAHQELGVRVSFHDEASPNGQWMCRCTYQSVILNEAGENEDMYFPNQSAGFIPVDLRGALAQPTFARKKDAKKYAAKCCVEWLMSENLMPSDGASVAYLKPKLKAPPTLLTKALVSPKKQQSPPPTLMPPPPKREKVNGSGSGPVGPIDISSSSSENHTTPDKRPSTPATSATTTLNSEQPKLLKPWLEEETTESDDTVVPDSSRDSKTTDNEKINVRDPRIPATTRVIVMCERLGISVPQYKTTPISSEPGYYRGYPDFGVDSVQIPDPVGRVPRGFTIKAVKEAIAEQVLEHLLKVLAKRMAMAEALLRQMGGAAHDQDHDDDDLEGKDD
ncbi:hypothetical protein B0H66DRAFT_601990 [Apodospora peruviana]|uniref:DRBM domain-containing protein n=1 Tax=Apodospora peruviana TaxID=516989 RepID=A0AAE0M954_9PEZI|nr:hypothetical protein B0H66DRAFT_601990 [Apodospora peruviana]